MQYLFKCFYLVWGLCFFISASSFADSIVSEHDVRQYNLGLGKKIFHSKCIKCHEDTEVDAPLYRDVEDWGKRIEVPVDKLVDHAINGHGKMPKKGGFEELTDRQVSAAVAYIVDQTRRLIISSNGQLVIKYKDVCESPDSDCSAEEIDNRIILEVLMLLTNQK